MVASHPDYPAVALALHLLGVTVNPSYWFGMRDPKPELQAYRKILEDELEELLGLNWRPDWDFEFE